MNKRMGANSRKAFEEERARRPQRIKKRAKIASVVILVCAAIVTIYMYSPLISARISDAFKSVKRTPAEFHIADCSRYVGARLETALDSLERIDTLYVDRDDILKAAAKIPEIEKVKIGKSKDKKTRVSVTERTPVAIVHGGDVCLVDNKGIRFSVTPGRYYDLPLVNFGNAIGDTLNLDIFNAVKKASDGLDASFFGSISQIDISDSSSVHLIFKSGKTEFILASGDVTERMAHVKKLADRLNEENGEPARVDLRFRNLAYSSNQ